MDERLDNTKEIAEAIFSKPPGKLNSIDLSLEEQTANEAAKYNIDNFISNILHLITLHGIRILFGHTKLMELTNDQIFLIQQYTRSYGYNLHTKINNNLIEITFQRTFI